LKVLQNQKTDPEEFRLEGKILAGLSHPNIVVVHDAPIVDGRSMIEMELVPGVTLSQWMRALPPPGFLERILIIEQVAAALGYAHAAGVQHRDLKPGNIMIMPSNCAKVLDFGLARRRSPGGIQDPSVGLGGTLTYMSPEQFEKSSSGFASDVFAFGIIAYELASCSHPFRRETDFLTMEAIMRTDPPPLRWQVAGVPESLEAAIELGGVPAARPHSSRIMR
jgi:serine/threonine-protein kinase